MPDVLPEDSGAAPAKDDDTKLKSEPDFVAAWLDALDSSSAEEKPWREDAEKACKAYRGEDEKSSRQFNIYHANIETLYPALYNSTPVPDVRRRYLDNDPVGKAVADLLERAISYSIDAYDFDATMSSTVKDMAMVGRGVSRVRYEPQFGPDGTVAYEQVNCEYVPWRSFRRGPGRLWSDVGWVAFEHFLDKPTIEQYAGDVISDVPFTYHAGAKDSEKNNNQTAPRFGKRAHVWEVWDKDSRRVEFICPDYPDRRLWTAPDPLGLEGFFPIPRPMQAIGTTDTLIPIASYSLYETLIEELNQITARISKLVAALRPRGGYAGVSKDIEAIITAGDAELVPITGAEMLVQGGGSLESAIVWFPLEPVVKALAHLVQQREMVKQTIYEVTKIADVMRGATNPHETASAQNLKAQWGSLSIQRMQAEVARFARDLFRLKTEIIANKFSMQTLTLMTGLKFPKQQDKQAVQQRLQQQAQPKPPQPGQPPAPPPQPSLDDVKIMTQPTIEEVEKLLREDAMRGFRVDIESDSTIRGDLARNQQQMGMFLQGTAQFAGAVGVLVKEKAMPGDVAIEIYSAFTRQFKLGKQVEDALDAWADKAKKAGDQTQDKADPKLEAEKVRAEATKAQTQLDMQVSQAKHGMDMQKLQAESQISQGKLAADVQFNQAKLGMKAQELELDKQRMMMEMETAQYNAWADAQARSMRPIGPAT